MKKIQQISLLVVAFACLYIAYERYFVSHYGWRSPATLVALSIVLIFQVWELERPEKELTMNELMDNMNMQKSEKTKSKWYQKPITTFAWWLGILTFAIWIKSNILVMTSSIGTIFFLGQIAIEKYEEIKKQQEMEKLSKKIEELKGASK
jgi:hypothetical protein